MKEALRKYLTGNKTKGDFQTFKQVKTDISNNNFNASDRRLKNLHNRYASNRLDVHNFHYLTVDSRSMKGF